MLHLEGSTQTKELPMSKLLAALKSKSGVAGLVLALSFGALTPAGAYTYSGFQSISTHEYWRSFSVDVDGAPSAGVMTKIGNDRMAAFLLLNHRIVLTMSAQSWNFQPNDEVNVSISIQGHDFTAKAHAVSTHELSLDVSQDNFISSLTQADKLNIQVKGENWGLDLVGLDNSFSDALNAVKNIDASL
jgi:hypothetical protein